MTYVNTLSMIISCHLHHLKAPYVPFEDIYAPFEGPSALFEAPLCTIQLLLCANCALWVPWLVGGANKKWG
jgi:hypothetical protein